MSGIHACASIMLVRALTADDALSFRALRLAALEDSPSTFASDHDDERNRASDDIAGWLTLTDRQAVFGAFEDGQLIGVAGVRRDVFRGHRHKAHLWGVCVAPGNRGAGVGSKVLTEALGFAKNMPGVTHVHLTVASTNVNAIRLYRSLGFEEIGRESGSIFDDDATDDATHDELHLCLALRPSRA